MNYYIGADFGTQKHSIHIMSENDERVKEFEIENDLKGFRQLGSVVQDLENVQFCFETKHGPLVDYFRNKGVKMYSVNPLKVKRFKQIKNVTGDKDDRIDACTLSEYLRVHHTKMHEMIFNSTEVEELNMLRISHDRITKEQIRCENRLTFLFRQYFPLYGELFSSTGAKILLHIILHYPTWNDLKPASEEEIVGFLSAHHYRVKRNIKRVLAKVRDYNQAIAPEVEKVLSQEAQLIAKMLLLLKEQLNELERQMGIILDHHRLGEVFKSLPGAGTVLAGKLCALLGDQKSRFNKANEVQALFGTAPMNYKSGKYHRVMMRRACNKKARSTLYQFAFSSMKFCKWARRYYDGQRAKGKTNSVSIRALSNKWLNIIYTMWKKEECYKEQKYILKKIEKVA